MSTEDLKLKFDGQTHQIEANTLINSLLHFTNIVQEVNKELATGNKVEVKVNALPEGSFLCHITVQSIIDATQNIFSKENIAVAKEIVDVVTGVYKLGKLLKGKAATEVTAENNRTTVKNVEGTVVVINNPTYNIYTNNRVVREALSREFQTLANDPNVTGFELLDTKNEPLVQIDKPDFAEIAAIEDMPQLAERAVTKVGMLNIVRVAFERNMKWEFYFEGIKISAKLNDDEFVKLVDAGESFAKGDTLEAEIEIRQEFEPTVNAYINRGYKVIKILRHIPRPGQTKLPFSQGQ
jgi:hypothetical protein